jgi:uncharacterized membrane-anchored protein YitT (DUF2179 family)
LKLSVKSFFNPIKTVSCILLGNLTLAFLVSAFVIPHGIVMGGTTGIGIMMSKILPVEPALFVLALNLILLFLGLLILGKKLFLTTVVSSVLYPALLALMQRIPGIDRLTDDTLLAALFAGCLLGISIGLVMRVGASTGGTDIVNLILHKWFHLPISFFVYLVDILIILGQVFISDPEQILLGLALLIIETLVFEQVTVFGKSQIQIFAVTARFEEVRHALLTDLEAGVTMTMIETGALAKSQKAVLCVIPPRKLHAATKAICKIDPNAFITITKIKEVRGRGFTLERRSEQLKENTDTEF